MPERDSWHPFEASIANEPKCVKCGATVEAHDSMIVRTVMTKAEFEARWPSERPKDDSPDR